MRGHTSRDLQTTASPIRFGEYAVTIHTSSSCRSPNRRKGQLHVPHRWRMLLLMFWFTSLFLSLWSQASSHYVRTVVYTQHLYLELVHDSTRPIRARARVVPLPLTRGAQSHSHTAHTQDSPAPTHLLLLLSTLCVSAPALPSAPSAPLAGPTSAPLCLRPRACGAPSQKRSASIRTTWGCAGVPVARAVRNLMCSLVRVSTDPHDMEPGWG